MKIKDGLVLIVGVLFVFMKVHALAVDKKQINCNMFKYVLSYNLNEVKINQTQFI